NLFLFDQRLERIAETELVQHRIAPASASRRNFYHHTRGDRVELQRAGSNCLERVRQRNDRVNSVSNLHSALVALHHLANIAAFKRKSRELKTSDVMDSAGQVKVEFKNDALADIYLFFGQNQFEKSQLRT